jgi:hypothetical protein
MMGWAYARDSPEEAAKIVTAAGSQLGASHQLWTTNEVNKLIWPLTKGARGAEGRPSRRGRKELRPYHRRAEGGWQLTAAVRSDRPDDSAGAHSDPPR